MRQNREDIDNRSPNPTILEQDRLGTKENKRPRTWPKSLARNRPRLEGEVCAPRSVVPGRRPEDFQSNPICDAAARPAFARVSSGRRSAVGVGVELLARDLLVEDKLRK